VRLLLSSSQRFAARFGLAVVLVSATSCSRTRQLPPCDESVELAQPPKDPAAVVVAAAGDIATCPGGRQDETAMLVEALQPDLVLTLGDHAYANGSLDEFVDCYHASWGRFRSITRPAPGNHEYHAPHAGPYYSYFCGGSGPPLQGWTSFDIGAWHIVSLNSVCGGDAELSSSMTDEFGGCGPDSPQARWLEADLAAHPSACTLAFWHHPRFSSGVHGNGEFMRHLWRILHKAGVELALTGHSHAYERFAPMASDGRIDLERGLRQFVVGTGGAPLHELGRAVAGSELQHDSSYGVLRLELRERSYAWSFVSVDGSFTDQGEQPCHD
jgi:acid phosphatase type 7